MVDPRHKQSPQARSIRHVEIPGLSQQFARIAQKTNGQDSSVDSAIDSTVALDSSVDSGIDSSIDSSIDSTTDPDPAMPNAYRTAD